MTDISAFELDSAALRPSSDHDSLTATLLSALLIVGFPASFWMSLLEFANYVLSLGISNATRLVAAGTLISLLSIIWGFIVISVRQRRTLEREAALRDHRS